MATIRSRAVESPSIWGDRGSSGGIPRPLRSLWRRLLRLRFHLFQRHRYDNYAWEEVQGRRILVLPQVFNPALFAASRFLVQNLNSQWISPGCAVLDLGTGAGLAAIVASEWAGQVTAVDINPMAVRCARINVLVNQVEDRVQVLEGDLFGPLGDHRFDVVLFNPPFYRGEPRDALDRAWRSPDVVDRFAAVLRRHLTSNGCALVVLSSIGASAEYLAAFQAHGLKADVIARRDVVSEVLAIHRLQAEPGRVAGLD